ncbi:hypothetical protein ACFVYR_14360 [Streptomyces sp. NPDC058284]|uniref:hypothetical protein n=1 Tax=unclassified Streptomyces TaxID=2593676 RepID=UPI00365A271E
MRPKDDAEGVLSTLPCTALAEDDADAPADPQIVGYLEIRAPHKRPPTARSTCACGRDIAARGVADVHALIDSHAYHRTVCPLHDQPERRNAA